MGMLQVSNFFKTTANLADCSAVNSLTMPGMDYRRAREALRDQRHRRGLSVVDLAELAGVERTTIYRVEKLRKFPDYRPDFDTIEKLCAGMKLPLSEFFAQIESAGAPLASAPVKPDITTIESAEADFAERLSKACLDAATRSRRAQTRALLEDLAVAFGMTDPEQGDRAIDAIRARRDA